MLHNRINYLNVKAKLTCCSYFDFRFGFPKNFTSRKFKYRKIGTFIDKEFGPPPSPPPPEKCALNLAEIAYITTFHIDGWVCGGPLGDVLGVPGPPGPPVR